MRSIVIIAAAVMAIAAAVPSLAADIDLRVDSRKLKKRLMETGAQDMDSYDTRGIFKDYQANEVAADKKYKGKWFVVTGKVSEIAKDFRGKPYLVFAMDSYGVASIRADLFDDQVCGVSKDKGVTSCSAIDRAAKLKKGQKIDIECKGAGMLMNTPMLRECLISD